MNKSILDIPVNKLTKHQAVSITLKRDQAGQEEWSKLINAQQIVHLYRQIVKVADRMQILGRQAREYLKFAKAHPELLAWRDNKLNQTVDELVKDCPQSVKLNLKTKTVQMKHYCFNPFSEQDTVLDTVPFKANIPEYLWDVKCENMNCDESGRDTRTVQYLSKVGRRCIKRDDTALDKIYRQHVTNRPVAKSIKKMLKVPDNASLGYLRIHDKSMRDVESRLLRSSSSLRNKVGRLFHDRWHKMTYLAYFRITGNVNFYNSYNYDHFVNNVSLESKCRASRSERADYLLYVAPHETRPIL